ncbi:MAG: aspartyl protease family protein [Saprospiraceae bacterium]|nr:aspartyl protease family protein [Saprospiraceae bacterium]
MISSKNISLICFLVLWLVDTSLQAAPLPVRAAKTSIPFELVQGKIVVKATVNKRSGYFIVDTAFPGLALNHQLFRGKTKQGQMNGIATSTTTMTSKVVDFNLGEIDISKAAAEIIDLDRVMATLKIQLSGLIGWKIFKNHTVVFDFEAKELVLYDAEISRELLYVESYGQPHRFGLSSKGHLLCLPFTIKGVSFQFALDSAAGTNMINGRKINKLGDVVDYVDRRRLGGIGGEDRIVDRVKLHQVNLGEIAYPAMYTVLCEFRQINLELPGKSIDGILGFPFFQAHLMAINFKTRELWVWTPEKKDWPSSKPLLTQKNKPF